jgi:hypothetical protein
VNIPENYSNLLFSPITEDISIQSSVLADFENVSELKNWFTAKDFEQNLTLGSSHVLYGNFSLQISYNKSYMQGGGNLNYPIEMGENTSAYRWVSAWLYYPVVPPANANVEVYLFDNSWNVLDQQTLLVTRSGWNNLLFTLGTANLSSASFLRYQFWDADFVNTTTTIIFDDIQLVSISSENTNILSNPAIHFQEVNPTTYTVHVANATQPYYLILSETYNPSWKVYNGSINWLEAIYSEPLSAEHFYVNGYANAWYINRTGTYTLTFYYCPQSFFYISLTMSLTVFLACLVYLTYSHKKVIWKRTKMALKHQKSPRTSATHLLKPSNSESNSSKQELNELKPKRQNPKN